MMRTLLGLFLVFLLPASGLTQEQNQISCRGFFKSPRLRPSMGTVEA